MLGGGPTAPDRPVEVSVEADNREPVVLCDSVLVRIVEVQRELLGRPHHGAHFSGLESGQIDASGVEHVDEEALEGVLLIPSEE